MSSNSGGNSRQRKQTKRAEQRIADEVAKRLSPQTGNISSLQAAIPEVMPQRGLKETIHTFWQSTPIWGGIGVLIGMVASQLSLKMVYIAVWGVFLFEFVRVGFFRRRSYKVAGNLIAGIVLGLCFLGLWEITPKPKESPTFDQELDAIAKKFPWIASPPAAQHVIETKVVYPAPKLQFSVTDKKVLALDNTSGDSDLLDFQINGLAYCLDPASVAGRATIQARATFAGDLDFPKHFDLQKGEAKRIDLLRETRYSVILRFHKCISDTAFDALVNYVLLRVVFTKSDTRETFVHYIVLSPHPDQIDLAQHPEMTTDQYKGPHAVGFARSISQVIKEDARTYYGTEYHEYQP